MAAEVEDDAVEGYDGQGEEGGEPFGQVHGIEAGEGSDEHEGGQHIGYEDGAEAVAGVDDYGDCIANSIVGPLAGVDFDGLVLSLGKATAGVGLAGGTGAEDAHLYGDMAVGDGGDGGGMGGYFFHDRGAFLQFLTQRPSRFILCTSPL